jgi:hypothetical protein
MAAIGELRDLIRAATEGVAGGLEALRAAGLAVDLDDFAVEVSYADGDPERPGEVGASVRFSFGGVTDP